MFRFSIFKSSILRISKQNKNKFILTLNLLIFITFFALLSSGISIFFERKIDELERKNIISEFNNLIFSNQIERTASNLKFTENTLDKYYESESYLHILYTMSSNNLRLFNEREKFYDPHFLLQRRVNSNSDEIKRALSDGMMIADTLEEIQTIEKYNENYLKLEEKFSKIISDISLYRSKNSPKKDASRIEYNEFYKEYNKFNLQYIDLLKKQIDFFLFFNTKYFNDKKKKSEKNITLNLKKIDEYSLRETQFIIFAFFIQVIIFLTIQALELGFEYQNRKLKK